MASVLGYRRSCFYSLMLVQISSKGADRPEIRMLLLRFKMLAECRRHRIGHCFCRMSIEMLPMPGVDREINSSKVAVENLHFRSNRWSAGLDDRLLPILS